MSPRVNPLARRFPSRARDERGVATVEAAIALPILLVLMLAGVEVTRAFVQYTVLSNTVRNAARHVAGRALLGTTQTVSISTALATEARNLTVYGNEAGSGTALLPGLIPTQVSVTNAGSNNISVAAVYAFQPLFGPQLPRFGVSGAPITTAFNMNITVTMRAL